MYLPHRRLSSFLPQGSFLLLESHPSVSYAGLFGNILPLISLLERSLKDDSRKHNRPMFIPLNLECDSLHILWQIEFIYMHQGYNSKYLTINFEALASTTKKKRENH